jgi:VTC domain
MYMNTDFFQIEIAKVANTFEKISLQEMDGVKLMDRVDVKYLIPIHLLPALLCDAKNHYRILEINNERLMAYETLYYDTPDLALYHNHQSGRMKRYKVRFRNYVASNLSFFEIKFKNQKGRTIKTRIKQPNSMDSVLNDEKTNFLHEITPLSAETLKGNLMVNYQRITLVGKINTERLTIDLNLTFSSDLATKGFPEIAIAEVKQERLGASPIIDIFKKFALREGSISKYCLGVITTNKHVKHNRFKQKFLFLQKTINQYNQFVALG